MLRQAIRSSLVCGSKAVKSTRVIHIRLCIYPVNASYISRSTFRCMSNKKGPWGPDDGIESGFRPVVEGDGNEPWIPEYTNKLEEGSAEKRSRLKYQSRKRGIAENGLLLGTFADKHLDGMSEEEMSLYDRLINLPTNDWDIYYWVTCTKPTPDEFDNIIMDKLKEHAKNSDRESRIFMPPLRPPAV